MKKIIIFTLLHSCIAITAFAQSQTLNSATHGSASAAAHERVSMQLSNILEFTFTNTGSSRGGAVSLPFNTMHDYTQGVASTPQELRIRTNKKFSIGVKTNASYFDYSGTSTMTTAMPVDSVLDVEVESNRTGGNVMPPFGNGKFVALSNRNLNIVSNGDLGSDQRFSIKYKAKPGITHPTGTYTVDVIFTASQQ